MNWLNALLKLACHNPHAACISPYLNKTQLKFIFITSHQRNGCLKYADRNNTADTGLSIHKVFICFLPPLALGDSELIFQCG